MSLFNPTKETFRNFADVPGLHYTIQQRTGCVSQSGDSRVWVGTRSDLCYFHREDVDEILSGKKNVSHMYIQDIQWGITNPSVLCVFEDFFHNIWIGSNGGGASLISHRSSFFKNWRINKIPGVTNGLNDKEVLTICIAADESIWMGTDGGGLNVNRKGKNGEIYSLQTGDVSFNAYFSSLKDSDNNLWFGTYRGIDVYNPERQQFSFIQSMQNHAVVSCLFEDDRRNIWIGTNKGLEIYELDTKKRELFTTGNCNLPTNEIKSIAQDKQGNLWIGTLNKGITIFNPQMEQIKHLNDSSGFRYNFINQIFRDSRGRMWVATTEGLILFPDENLDQYTIFDLRNGLACPSVCAIVEDEDGNIWLSTVVGISCYLESEKRFLNYDHSDGALYGNYMDRSVAKRSDGTIYFGSINGTCYFQPADKPTGIALPPVVFTTFKVHNKDISEEAADKTIPMIDKKVSLLHNQDIFSIAFNVMDKSLQGQVEYAYCLEGLNDTWINIGHENQVTFRNIPYHTYKLHVRARYKSQQWQENVSTLTIIINPPVWLTWWAKLFYVFVAVVIVLLAIKSYKRRLQLNSSLALEKENTYRQQELNEERLKFYTNITHELKTPLTLILGPLEDLQSDHQLKEEQQKKLSLIHKSTIRLLNLVKQILEFRKTETQNRKLCVIKSDLSEKLREIGLKYKELHRNNKVTFDIHIEEIKNKEIYFDPEVITMIIDNLLSNAFKYTQDGKVTLSLRTVVTDNNEYSEIEVTDTGMGIPHEEVSRIFDRYYQANKDKNIPGFGIGLALVQNLVDLHEATILVQSEPQTGTSFRVRLLTNNIYPEAIHIEQNLGKVSDEQINKPILLIVEDDSDIRDYVAGALAESFEIIVAENGEQGVEAAFASIPDIIISDIMMPVKDGIELCREVKANVATSHIPVILLTAKDTIQDKTEGYNVGADSYITKPFSASLLKSRISNLIEARKKIALLISSNATSKQSIIKESLNRIDNEFIERLTSIIEENLMDEKIDIPSIAAELSMSYSSLYRKLKALTGMSTGEFIRKIRIRKSEELLLTGKYNISEIANLVGLNSVSYFRECFKDEYGMSPTEYLKKIKKG